MVAYGLSGTEARVAARHLSRMAALKGGLDHEGLARVYGYVWNPAGFETVVTIAVMGGLLTERDGTYFATKRGARI